MQIASSGLEAQSTRLRIVSENLANANSTGRTAGIRALPAQDHDVHRGNGSRGGRAAVVKVKDVGVDSTPFRLDYEPSHPAADQNGYVKLPNVNSLIEMADMREIKPVL